MASAWAARRRGRAAGQDRLEGGADDGFGQLARRVVRPRAAARLAGLQHHRPARHEVGGGGDVDDRLQGRVQAGDAFRRGHRLAHPLGQRPVGPVAQPLGALAARLAEQHLEVDGGRRACFFCALIDTDRPVAVSMRNPIIVS